MLPTGNGIVLGTQATYNVFMLCVKVQVGVELHPEHAQVGVVEEKA